MYAMLLQRLLASTAFTVAATSRLLSTGLYPTAVHYLDGMASVPSLPLPLSVVSFYTFHVHVVQER
jgi:hypothetical protein